MSTLNIQSFESNPPVYKMFIDGQWVESVGGGTFESYNPATERAIGHLQLGTREDAVRAIHAARAAAEKFRETSPWERAELLKRIAAVIAKRQDELAFFLTMDQGKPYHSEAVFEIRNMVKTFEEASEQIKWLESAVIPVEDKNKRVISIRQPRGVYAIVTPWNFPFMIPTEYLSAGLAAGNTLVWVPAPTTSICAVKLAECLEEAGLPQGVVNLVTGRGDVVGDEIVSNSGTDAIGFTGSTATGKQIAIRGAGKPLLLELGGNGPTIVLKDADLELAARSIAGGCFDNAGQVCSSTERILADHRIYDELLDKLVAHAKKIRVGDPFHRDTTMGPLNNGQVVEKNRAHADDALAKGARLLTGGKPLKGLGSSLFFAPTVIADLTLDSLYHTEESFGPVAPVFPFETNEEALRIALDNRWGLVNSVFTTNLKDAVHFAEKLRAGVVNINDNSNYWEPHLPFGGASGKASGLGRIGGKYSIMEMSDLKTITLDLR
ncbi:aldehyde dehydrogenase family protein [Paenibacillus sp. GCM10027626]|uniref:aldehyde dehydrogenase family protein n=1 Tax=Paenibacillus sp. GCM10027626 TaxID=3273411 RepID=UPI00362D859F